MEGPHWGGRGQREGGKLPRLKGTTALKSQFKTPVYMQIEERINKNQTLELNHLFTIFKLSHSAL